jgi:hemoglobin
MPEKSLYERLGGVFAIAAVVDHFSDAVVKNPIVGQKSKNAQLREWHTKNQGRLPGLKFMRTRPPSPARHRSALRRSTTTSGSPLAEFDEVAAELGRTLDFFRSRSARRPKSWQPSPPTKTMSPPGTSRGR